MIGQTSNEDTSEDSNLDVNNIHLLGDDFFDHDELQIDLEQKDNQKSIREFKRKKQAEFLRESY